MRFILGIDTASRFGSIALARDGRAEAWEALLPGEHSSGLSIAAAYTELLRARGHHAARALAERLEQALRESTLPSDDDEEDEEVEPGGPR